MRREIKHINTRCVRKSVSLSLTLRKRTQAADMSVFQKVIAVLVVSNLVESLYLPSLRLDVTTKINAHIEVNSKHYKCLKLFEN